MTAPDPAAEALAKIIYRRAEDLLEGGIIGCGLEFVMQELIASSLAAIRAGQVPGVSVNPIILDNCSDVTVTLVAGGSGGKAARPLPAPPECA